MAVPYLFRPTVKMGNAPGPASDIPRYIFEEGQEDDEEPPAIL